LVVVISHHYGVLLEIHPLRYTGPEEDFQHAGRGTVEVEFDPAQRRKRFVLLLNGLGIRFGVDHRRGAYIGMPKDHLQDTEISPGCQEQVGEPVPKEVGV